jgi:hypothetical protein
MEMLRRSQIEGSLEEIDPQAVEQAPHRHWSFWWD